MDQRNKSLKACAQMLANSKDSVEESGESSHMTSSDAKIILEMLTVMKSELQEIKERLNMIEKSSNNMNRHIGFVESVWDSVRSPFEYLTGLANLPETLPPDAADTLFTVPRDF